jgi:hypothetical protein
LDWQVFALYVRFSPFDPSEKGQVSMMITRRISTIVSEVNKCGAGRTCHATFHKGLVMVVTDESMICKVDDSLKVVVE